MNVPGVQTGSKAMTLSEATKQATQEKWRELGFFYEQHKNPPRWHFVGSPSGLTGFVQLLDEYLGNPRHKLLSEHEHYGPYMYLKIQTAERPEIDSHSIRGSLDDLARLRDLIATRLHSGSVGQTFEIGSEYSESVSFPLQFEICPEGFDPASADLSSEPIN